MGSLDGKTALVTGAGRGIGRAIALGLAGEGAAVVAVARTASQVEEVAREIVARGGRALGFAADVADPARVAASVAAAETAFGPVDVLVNDAGHNDLGRLDEQPPDEWWRVVEVNVKGTYLYCRATMPKMAERKWGRVVNVSSIAGKVGLIYGSAYCAAKHAIVGLTRALALEFAEKGVTVNAVCPGLVETALTEHTYAQRARLFGMPAQQVKAGALQRIPQKTAMKPEEVVPAVLFLASPAAARTTGEAVNVSAGLVMH